MLIRTAHSTFPPNASDTAISFVVVVVLMTHINMTQHVRFIIFFSNSPTRFVYVSSLSMTRKSGPTRKGIFLLFSKPCFLSLLARILLLSTEHTSNQSINTNMRLCFCQREYYVPYLWLPLYVRIAKITRVAGINYFIYIRCTRCVGYHIDVIPNESSIYSHSKNSDLFCM